MATKIDKLETTTAIRWQLDALAEAVAAIPLGLLQRIPVACLAGLVEARHDIRLLEAALLEDEFAAMDARTTAAVDIQATPSSENNTGGGAAEKMPGGGSGNFDREGGLENPNAPFTPAPHVSCVEVAGKIDEIFDYKISYDDHHFFAAVTVPVKVLFSASRETVYRDPVQSVGVVDTIGRDGNLNCAGPVFREDKHEVVWRILEQSEKIEDLPEFKQAYGLWQQRAEAYNRAEELYTKAA